MKLVVDIGNSFSKLAVFENDDIIDFQIVDRLYISYLKSIVLKFPKITSSIVSSVAKHDEHIFDILKKQGTTIELTHGTIVPFTNSYSTPRTLGKDRIAIASAAVTLYPGKNVLVIDIGTCVTYDLILSQGEYLGGGISPGLEMRFKSLNNFTHGLPLVSLQECSPEIELVGNSTSKSIISGVINGLQLEVEHTINQYKMRYNPLITVISVGDYKYFEKLVKSNIFATPNIVVRGLKNILDFNEKD